MAGEHIPGPFGAALDALAQDVGGWPDGYMPFAVEVIGEGEDPQIMLTGSAARWMPRAKRWKFEGPTARAVVRLSEYRRCINKAQPA